MPPIYCGPTGRPISKFADPFQLRTARFRMGLAMPADVVFHSQALRAVQSDTRKEHFVLVLIYGKRGTLAVLTLS